jgi:hypothetical protein
MSVALIAEDLDAIENCVLPLTELLPAPYDNPHMTARMRCSMLSMALKTIPLVLLDLRMEKYYDFSAMTVS